MDAELKRRLVERVVALGSAGAGEVTGFVAGS